MNVKLNHRVEIVRLYETNKSTASRLCFTCSRSGLDILNKKSERKVKFLSNVDLSRVEIVKNNLFERLPGLIKFVKFVKKSIIFFKEI